MTKNRLLEKLKSHGQQHLLDHWDQLTDAEQLRLSGQIEQVDFELLAQLLSGDTGAPDWEAVAARALPPRAIRIDGQDNAFSRPEALSRGESTLRAGRAAMILVAGGQGTRLGFDHPKGMYPLGPVSGRSLFQILVDRLMAVAARYQVGIPLYVMTSPATHDETVDFFQRHANFGLPASDFHIFCQGVMPAVAADTGRVLLAEPGSLFLSPDGHGGMLQAFQQSGCLAGARDRGIELLFYGQVDNPLLQICDPLLLGYHLLAESELTTQAVQKVGPLERVGNVVNVDGRTRIIEYSDLPEKYAQRTNPDGTLLLWAGNMAVHVFDLEFLARAAGQPALLPFHQARKQAESVDSQGRVCSVEAIKFERFIFDLLPAANNALVVEAQKDCSFAPVKNSNDAAADTPRAAQQAMLALDTAMLRQAGVEVAEGVDVEINPRWALDAEELREKLEPGTRLERATYFEGHPAASR